MRCLLLLAVALSTSSSAAGARVWNVNAEGTGDAPTIQAAIDSATAGDWIEVAAGTYTWTSQNASGESMIHLKPGVSLGGPAIFGGAVLDAEQRGRVLVGDEPGDVLVWYGFTIENGKVTGPEARGAGVLAIGGCRLTLLGAIVQNNVAEASGTAEGGGVYMVGGEIGFPGTSGVQYVMTIKDNVARGETASGGGIFCIDTAIGGSVVRDNVCESGSGPATGAGVSALRGEIVTSRFHNNRAASSAAAAAGGGIHCDGSTVESCILLGNDAAGTGGQRRGGGIFARGAAAISQSFVAGNPGGGIAAEGAVTVRSTLVYRNSRAACDGAATWTCCDLFGNEGGDQICGADGGGNFAADPLLCFGDPVETGSLWPIDVHEDSPCIHPPEGFACETIGVWDWVCGPTAVQPRSWTAVKSLYR